jgi:hypothetical protein
MYVGPLALVEKQKNLGNTPPPGVAGIYGFSGEKKNIKFYFRKKHHTCKKNGCPWFLLVTTIKT